MTQEHRKMRRLHDFRDGARYPATPVEEKREPFAWVESWPVIIVASVILWSIFVARVAGWL